MNFNSYTNKKNKNKLFSFNNSKSKFEEFSMTNERLTQERKHLKNTHDSYMQELKEKDKLLKKTQAIAVSLLHQLISIELSRLIHFETREWEINFPLGSTSFVEYIYYAIDEKKKLQLSIDNGKHYAFCKFDGIDSISDTVNFSLQLYQIVTDSKLNDDISCDENEKIETNNDSSAEAWLEENLGKLQSYTSDLHSRGENKFSLTIDGEIVFKGIVTGRFDDFVEPEQFLDLAKHLQNSLGLNVDLKNEKMDISWDNNISRNKKEG